MDDNVTPTRTQEICPRCKLQVSRRVSRCPHCGQPISNLGNLPIYIMGAVGLLALIFVVVLMLKSINTSDSNNSDATDDQTIQQPAPPPEKTPPLNK